MPFTHYKTMTSLLARHTLRGRRLFWMPINDYPSRHSHRNTSSLAWCYTRAFVPVLQKPSTSQRSSIASLALLAAACVGMQATDQPNAALSQNTTYESMDMNDVTDIFSLYLEPCFDANFSTNHVLASGSSGIVIRCVRRKDSRVFASKMLPTTESLYSDGQCAEEIEAEREINALYSIQRAGGHPNIVSFEGSYRHDTFRCIVEELVDGETLFERLQCQGRLQVEQAMEIAAQLTSALAFLQKQKLVHRDLKPENVMVSTRKDSFHVKLIDFGSAGTIPSASLVETGTTVSGTRSYSAPEVLARQEMSYAMDMWALGCLLYVMIAGRHPFDPHGCETEEEVEHRIQSDPVCFLHPVWKDVPADVKNLLRGLLQKNPNERMTVEEVQEKIALYMEKRRNF